MLSPNVTAAEFDDARHHATGLMPGLVSIGTNDVGTVLVDIERLAALEIRCDDPAVTGIGVLAAMAAEWEGAPWLDREESRIIGVGLPTELFEPYERIQLIDDTHVASMIGALTDAARNDAVRYPAGKHVQRVATDALLFGPTIVLVGPGHDDHAKTLAEAALLSGSGLCVVALCALPQGASQLVITGTHAVLEPFGLDLDHVTCLTPGMTHAIGELVDTSDDVTASTGWPPAWHLDELDEPGQSNITEWSSDGWNANDLCDVAESGGEDLDPDDDWDIKPAQRPNAVDGYLLGHFPEGEPDRAVAPVEFVGSATSPSAHELSIAEVADLIATTVPLGSAAEPNASRPAKRRFGRRPHRARTWR